LRPAGAETNYAFPRHCNAIERRLRSGALTIDDIPAPLREVQSNVIRRSPLAIPVDEQYDLAPLFVYYKAQFQP
jgi:hypothetical protein